MKKLLKIYDFNSDTQYYQMIVDSFINGQYSQAKEQFNAMPKANKVDMLKSVNGYWASGLKRTQIDILFDCL